MSTDIRNPGYPDERVSAWSRIAAQLTDGIASGMHAPGRRLPTEHALAEQFGVNRHTVRRALSSMAAHGLVRMVQGSGTYVEQFAVDLVLGQRVRHSESLQLAGLSGGMRVLKADRCRASAELGRTLKVAPRSNVLRVKVLGLAKDRPLHVSERFFPLPRFTGLDALLQQSGSITKAFLALGVEDYLRHESRIAAVLPTTDVATLLLQSVARPVIQVRSINVDAKGMPVEAATTFFAGDLVTLLVRPGG